jgi:hypothetical protein
MAQILRYARHLVSPFVIDFQQSSSLEKHLANDDCDSKMPGTAVSALLSAREAVSALSPPSGICSEPAKRYLL